MCLTLVATEVFFNEHLHFPLEIEEPFIGQITTPGFSVILKQLFPWEQQLNGYFIRFLVKANHFKPIPRRLLIYFCQLYLSDLT